MKCEARGNFVKLMKISLMKICSHDDTQYGLKNFLTLFTRVVWSAREDFEPVIA
jgi:hypothetical protein